MRDQSLAADRHTEARTPEIAGGPDAIRIVYWLMSRRMLQPFWRLLNFLSLRGMGHKNIYPSINGELRFLDEWKRSIADGVDSLTVLDIGANEGDYAAEVLARAPNARVHCFEPNPTTCERLRNRFEDFGQVRISELALGNTPGKLVLYDIDSRGTGQASFMAKSIDNPEGRILQRAEVSVSTVDDYVASNSIERVHLMKIDVEGFEKHVLEGAASTIESGRIDAIQLEWNTHNAAVGFTICQLAGMLSEYDIFKILPSCLYPLVSESRAYRPEIESFVYANFVALRRLPRD